METIKPTIAAALQGPQEKRRANGKSMAFFVLAGVLMGLIVLASWASDSRMTALVWVPGWMATWADREPNLRTAVPFIPLAFLLVRGFTRCGLKWPVAGALLVCGACLGLSELGQIFLPSRTADVADLLWGGIGILVGAVLGRGTEELNRKGAKAAKGRGGRG